jgi:hypothetical protein
MTHRPRRRSSIVALLVLAGLLLGACSSDSTSDAKADDTSTTTGAGGSTKVDAPGVTGTEIRYSSFGTDSQNPLGTCVLSCYDDGIKAFFAWKNSTGGIYGRKLVLSKELDDQLGKNKERALDIVSANDTFGAFGATQIPSGWADIAKTGMPFYTWSIHPTEMRGHENLFGYNNVLCIDCTSRMTAYIASLVKAKKAAGLGYGVSENSKVCANGVKTSLEKYKAHTGGTEAVYINDHLAFGLANGVGPEVTAMKKAGVDLIFTCVDLNGAKTIAQELQRQGMGDVPMVHPNTYDQAFVTAAGQLFEGDYMTPYFRPFEAKAGKSDLDEYKTWMGKTKADITEISMIGWLNAATAFAGLDAAGPSFDRQKVVDATNALKDFTAGGLMPPLNYGREHEPPSMTDPETHGTKYTCSDLLKVTNGKFKVVGDAAKPFNCWPGTTFDWSEPQHLSFDE